MNGIDEYLDGLARGEIRIARCTICGNPELPPQLICPKCSSNSPVTWETASGRGLVWSFCVFHKQYLPPPTSTTPYAVTIIELEEGVRVFASPDFNEPIEVGMKVRAYPGTDDRGGVRFVKDTDPAMEEQ